MSVKVCKYEFLFNQSCSVPQIILEGGGYNIEQECLSHK